MNRRNRKSKGNLSVLDGIDSEFEDIEQNFSDNPTVKKPGMGLESRSKVGQKKDTEQILKEPIPESSKTSRLKVDQKQVKTRLKVDHEVGQNPIKSRSKKKTKPKAILESRSKVGSKVGQKVGQKQIKSGLEVGQKTPISLIVGLQLRMLNFFFEKCLQEGSKKPKQTWYSERSGRKSPRAIPLFVCDDL